MFATHRSPGSRSGRRPRIHRRRSVSRPPRRSSEPTPTDAGRRPRRVGRRRPAGRSELHAPVRMGAVRRRIDAADELRTSTRATRRSGSRSAPTTSPTSGVGISVELVPVDCEADNSQIGNGFHGLYRTIDDVPEPIGVEHVETPVGAAFEFDADLLRVHQPVQRLRRAPGDHRRSTTPPTSATRPSSSGTTSTCQRRVRRAARRHRPHDVDAEIVATRAAPGLGRSPSGRPDGLQPPHAGAQAARRSSARPIRSTKLSQ